MNTKLYWIMRRCVLNLVFKIKSGLFHLSERKDKIDQISPVHLNVIRTVAVQALKGVTIVYLLAKFDGVLLSQTNTAALDSDYFKDIVLGGLGIAGVILGLYCSNVASIFSATYTNAPKSLANTFRNDIVTNSCIKQIIGYIVICIVMLLECIAEVKLYWISILALLFLTLRMVITFSITGNRAYALSDTFQIANLHYTKIGTCLRKISNQKFFSQDINFQNHLQKITSVSISTLLDIAKYNKDIPKAQNAAMLEFMYSNLRIIGLYWRIKSTIHFNSQWFKDKANYKQWHYASDHEIELSVKTGAPLNTSMERDIWWFENEVLRVNFMCLEKLLHDFDLESVQSYLVKSNALSKLACNATAVGYWSDHLKKIECTIMDTIYAVPNKTKEENEAVITSIIDIICWDYVTIFTGINSSLCDLDLNKEFQDANKIKKYKDCKFSDNAYFNNSACEKMFRHIEAEYAIEGRKITPDWFVEQTIAYQIYLNIGQEISALNNVGNIILGLGKKLYEQKQIYFATVVFSHCLEFKSKCAIIVSKLETIIPALEKKHFEPSVVWEKVSLEQLMKTLRTIEIEVPEDFAKCCGVFALNHWENRQDDPDFLGQCYNHLCEYLLEAIETDDIEKFEAIYKNFFSVVSLYQEYVRTSVIKQKEEHVQNMVFHVAVAPFVEYAMISGLAILWGEFTESTKWKTLVEETLKYFVEQNPDENIKLLAKIVGCIKADQRAILGIGNRDVLRTGWEMRIASSMMSNKRFATVYHEFGIETLKTSSNLLSTFLETLFQSYIEIHDSEEVFLVMCVNAYLNDEQKYRSQSGWEDKLNELEE